MRLLTTAGLMILLAGLMGCGPGEPETETESGVVVVRADDYEFKAPSTFPSGWVTLRFENQGEEDHFLLVWRLPEGRTFDEYAAQVAEPFQEHYTRYRTGELDQAAFLEELLAAIPEWFYEAVPMGGAGFTTPGYTSETMIHLEPGENYVLECYVRSKVDDHRFHGTEGMLRPLIVSTEETDLSPPEADAEIVISNAGLTVEGDLSAGSHVVRVRVEDAPEGFIRHNVHLAKLEGDQTTEDVARWLNWVDAMVPPAPADFLGGAGQTAPGRESYVMIDLEPGRFAWVSEMHGMNGFVHEFTVTEP